MKINISQDDFGALCICALRYCHGRETYMPGLVQNIVSAHIKDLSDKDVCVMVQDCDFQKKFDLYGNPQIDKPGWLKWEEIIRTEQMERKANAIS